MFKYFAYDSTKRYKFCVDGRKIAKLANAEKLIAHC